MGNKISNMSPQRICGFVLPLTYKKGVSTIGNSGVWGEAQKQFRIIHLRKVIRRFSHVSNSPELCSE